MDLINNLIFTALNDVPTGSDFGAALKPRFFPLPFTTTPKPIPVQREDSATHVKYYSYNIDIVQQFSAIDDTQFIEDAIEKHWADFVSQRNYDSMVTIPGMPTPASATVSFFKYPPYHLIYAYLVENTRIAQIMEKVIFLYLHDEKLTKSTAADGTTAPDPMTMAFQWIMNTETLFFKSLYNTSYRNVVSQVRTSQDATRRNAYYRMFGMDLAFGDMAANGPVNFYKAEYNNQPFIVLFEKFLAEIWQAYINARNTSGANTTDLFEIADTAQKLQEMLMSRRSTEKSFDKYRFSNLSREEYAAVVMMSWFYEVISYNSPLVQFLRCTATTPGERLINIGNKVGLPAHSKSEGLLDIAPPMNTLLRRIELGDYNDQTTIRDIVESQKNNLPSNDPLRLALDDLLLIINNWEKATGHKIKVQDAAVNGTVRVEPKLPRTTLMLN